MDMQMKRSVQFNVPYSLKIDSEIDALMIYFDQCGGDVAAEARLALRAHFRNLKCEIIKRRELASSVAEPSSMSAAAS